MRKKRKREMSREAGFSDSEEFRNLEYKYRLFLAPAPIPSFSPVQEINLFCDSAGDLIVQHGHSAGAHVPFHLVASFACTEEGSS